MKRLIALVLAGQMAISGAFAQPVLAEEPATEDASAIQIEDEGADEKATEKITEKAAESPAAEASGLSDMSQAQSAAEISDAPGTLLSDTAQTTTETPETTGDINSLQKSLKISVSGDGNAAVAAEINDEKIREKIKGILQEREILTACSVDLYLNNTDKKEPEIEMEEEIEISPESFGLYYVAENASGAGDFVRIPFTYNTEKKSIRFSSDKSGFYAVAVLSEEEKEEREEEGKEERTEAETETEDDGIEILDAGESLSFSAPMLKARLLAAPPAPANDELPAKHPTGYIESLDDDDEYIEMFKILEQADGTEPYDSSDGLGYDANDHNGIVRTNDAIDYTLQLTSAPYTEGAYYRNGYIGFKFVLPNIKPEEAEFAVEDMSWMVSGTGKYYDYKKKEETINGQTCQVLYAYMKLSSDTSGTPNMFPCIKQTANVRVKIGNMKNGATIQPKFYCWMDHNTTDGACKLHGKNEVAEATGNVVKITTRPAYDINIGTYTPYNSYNTLDFDKGTTDAPNYGKGKIFAGWFPVATGIAMRNTGNGANGLRGIEYPAGDITFDLNMTPYYYSDTQKKRIADDVSSFMAPIVYYGDIHRGTDCGTNYGRQQSVSGLIYDHSYGIVPYATGYNYRSCYNGGKTYVKQEGNILHVTVKDYKLDGHNFPYAIDWHSPTVSVYYDYHNYGLGGRYTNIGFFSSQEYAIGVSFDYDELEKKYGSGSAGLDIRVENVHIKGVSGNETAEVTTNNNTTSPSIPVRASGSYDNRLFFEGNNSTNCFEPSRWSASKSACLGDTLTLHGGIGIHNYSKAYVFGYDSLLKFDSEAFEPTGQKANGWVYTTHTLFAAKPDGTAWKDDAEKQNANISDMVYYKTYEDLKRDGKTCVGFLVSGRAQNTRTYTEQYYTMGGIFVKVRDNPDIVNKAYSIVESSNIYCYAEGSQPDNLPFYDEYYFDGKSLAEPTQANFKRPYSAPRWDDNGHFLGGGNHAMDTGDTMYIQPYQTVITKKVEQTVDDAQKALFNLDNGEKIVDFVIQPAIKSAIQSDAKTTLTVVDTLPSGMKYNGDSTSGGIYEKGATDSSHGSIKDGVAFEPKSVVENSNGTTTITWSIEDVKIKDSIPAIHYSATIDIDKAQNNQVYKNTVSISGTGDHRPQSEQNENISIVSIKVIKLFGFSISKIAQKEIYEIPEDISWDIAYNNQSKNAEPNVLMMDMMPYNGDEYGTNFHGSYTVKSLQLNLDDPTKYTFVYTLDESYRGKTTKDISADEARAKWTTGTIASDGTVSDMNGKTPVAWGIIGTLNGNTSLQGHLTIQTTGALADDDYFNGASMMKSNVLSHAAYVAHNISGYVFLDKNKNGTKDDGEPFMKGVTATLYKKGDRSTPVKNIDGKPCVATTGDDGFYEFEKTPNDDYEIVFTKNDMELYRMTPEHKDAAGWTNKATHEALNGDKLQNTSIDNVIGRSVVATQRDVLSRIAYHIDYTHLNLGLYLDKVKVPFTKVSTGKTPVSGAELKLLDEGGNTVDTWTTDGNKHIVYLYTGHSYLLKETKVPAGYLQAEDIKIEVDADGNIKANGKNTDKIEMIDMKTMVLPNTGGGMAPWTVRYIIMAAGIALFAFSRKRKYSI